MDAIADALRSFLPHVERAVSLWARQQDFQETREIRYAANADQREIISELKAEIKALKALLPKDTK